jgi:hypothetical protein
MRGAAVLGAGSLVRRTGVGLEPAATVGAVVTLSACRSVLRPKLAVAFGWVVEGLPNVRVGASGVILGIVGAGVGVITALLLSLVIADRECPPAAGCTWLPEGGRVSVDGGKCGR